jgi:secondary thiamine-phosphate synthase enzyme
MAEILTLATRKEKECIDLTEQVREVLRKSGVERGLCQVYSLHSTAAIIVNENADPNIGVDLVNALVDLVNALNQTFPQKNDWLHDRIDDNAQSHILASILGPSETIPVEGGELLLGTWQTILLVELDGPRPERRIAVQVLSQGT